MTAGAYAMAARQPGPPQVLHEIGFAPVAPAAGEVLIRHSAIGVNFIDCYFRSGLYPWPVPSDLVTGAEAAGVIEAVGDGVTGLTVGQRVAYTLPNFSYATHRTIAAQHVVLLPDGISDEVAAAVMLKGFTVRYLVKDSYAVKPGDTVLFHAAAGGVGLLAGQWLKAMGARAIGTAGGPDKVALARAHGFSEVIDYGATNFADEAKRLVPQGFEVVYDSVGKDTLARSLGCLRRHGTLVNFGQSSGPVTDFKVSDLAAGSYHLTRPVLFHFTSSRAWLEQAAADLFHLIGNGTLKIAVHSAPLREVARVHTDLEARRTTGSMVLIP